MCKRLLKQKKGSARKVGSKRRILPYFDAGLWQQPNTQDLHVNQESFVNVLVSYARKTTSLRLTIDDRFQCASLYVFLLASSSFLSFIEN